jgi:hypothetical protein
MIINLYTFTLYYDEYYLWIIITKDQFHIVEKYSNAQYNMTKNTLKYALKILKKKKKKNEMCIKI